MPKPQHGLVLPKAPTLEDSIRDGLRAPSSGSPTIAGGGRISGRGSPRGGSGGGTAYGGLEMLTPTQGLGSPRAWPSLRAEPRLPASGKPAGRTAFRQS